MKTINVDNLRFVPAYYEWHLIDVTNPEKVLFNVVDPVEELFDEDGNAYSLEELEHFCSSWMVGEEHEAENERDWSRLEELQSIPPRADRVMAEALYNYYIKEDGLC